MMDGNRCSRANDKLALQLDFVPSQIRFIGFDFSQWLVDAISNKIIFPENNFTCN